MADLVESLDTPAGRPAAETAPARPLALHLGHSAGWKAFSYAVLLVGAAISMAPFIWMILVSFMDLGEALASRPQGTAGYNLGNLLREHGRLAEAADVYRRTLELRPRDAKLHNNLATLLVQQRSIDAAIYHYQRALEIDPGYETARKNLAALRARR